MILAYQKGGEIVTFPPPLDIHIFSTNYFSQPENPD